MGLEAMRPTESGIENTYYNSITARERHLKTFPGSCRIRTLEAHGSEAGCDLHVEGVVARIGGIGGTACRAVVREGVVELEDEVLREVVVA